MADWVAFPTDPAFDAWKTTTTDKDYICTYEDMGNHERTTLTRTSDLMFSHDTFRAKTAFHSWLAQRFGTRTKDSRKYTTESFTHVCFAGGSFIINTPEDLEYFYRSVANFLWTGSIQYFFVERPPDNALIRMIMDLDLNSTVRMTTHMVFILTKSIQRVMAKFFPHQNLECIVSGAGYKTSKPKDAEVEYIKTGAHITWTHLFVSLEQIEMIRAMVIYELQEEYGPREPPMYNTWVDVVDSSVYGSSGIRMIGACKTSECPECHNARTDRIVCAHCNFSGLMNDGRPYFPMFVLDTHGNRDTDRETHLTSSLEGVVDLVKDTVYRTDLPLSDASKNGFVIPPEYASQLECFNPEHFHPPSDMVLRRMSTAHVLHKRAKRGRDDADHIRIQPRDRMAIVDDIPYQNLQTFIQSLTPKWAKLQIQNIVSCADRSAILARTHGPGCRHCINVMREHSSNHIYFYVTTNGLIQRCFCTKDNAGESLYSVKCSDFRGPLVQLPNDVMDELFPSHRAPPSIIDSLPRFVPSNNLSRETIQQRVGALKGLVSTINRLHESIVKFRPSERWYYWNAKELEHLAAPADVSGISSRASAILHARGDIAEAPVRQRSMIHSFAQSIATVPVETTDLIEETLKTLEQYILFGD